MDDASGRKPGNSNGSALRQCALASIDKMIPSLQQRLGAASVKNIPNEVLEVSGCPVAVLIGGNHSVVSANTILVRGGGERTRTSDMVCAFAKCWRAFAK